MRLRGIASVVARRSRKSAAQIELTEAMAMHERNDRLAAADKGWLSMLRRYLIFVAVGNVMWETLQLPLYTIWVEGTPGKIAFAVAHCTAGDMLIALACLAVALVAAGDKSWPAKRFWTVAVLTVATGVAYTVFSEWLNLVVRKSWAYSSLMPVVPILGIGLSPLMQWTLIPSAGLLWARRTTLHARDHLVGHE